MNTLYVKYCGGCNVTYNRTLLAQQVAKELNATLCYSEPDKCTYRLVFFGCLRECIHLPEHYVPVYKKTSVAHIIRALKKR